MMQNLLLVYVITLFFLVLILCTETLKVIYCKLCIRKIINDGIYWEGRVSISSAWNKCLCPCINSRGSVISSVPQPLLSWGRERKHRYFPDVHFGLLQVWPALSIYWNYRSVTTKLIT